MMKQLFLVFLLCGLVLMLHAQEDSGDNAFSKYKSGDYLTAIKLYQSKIAKMASLYDEVMLATCYEKADSPAQAKQIYKKVIASKTDNDPYSMHFKVESSEALAAIYMREKNYRQALNYYQLFASLFEKARFDDVNRGRFHFFNTNNQARCYAEMGMPDSAIKVLTPYMFYSYKNLHALMFNPPNYRDLKDSIQHDSTTRFYLALLQKRYTNKQIKAEFEKAERSFRFSEDRSPVDKHGFIMEHIKCSVDIYGVSVIFAEKRIADKPDKLLIEIQNPYYTKDYQLEYFRQLLICRLVRGLKG